MRNSDDVDRRYRRRMTLLTLSATELMRGYRRHAFSPVDVIREVNTRISALNPVLNAFTTLAPDEAERTARECEQALMRGDPRPLLGVPIAVKDLIDTAGLRTTYGSSMFADHVPSHDAQVVKKLKASGAIIVGKSATHEFAWGFTTANPHYGPTRNPWDCTRIPGGSSGGSAAAVAAHLVPVAIGTDTGGSIRLPAAFCGIVGLKPTYGRVNLQGVFPLAPSLDHVGPLARDPADLQLLLSVIGGFSERDIDHTTDDLSLRPLIGTRVGIAESLHQPAPCAASHAVWREACRILGDAGATIVDLDPLRLPDAVGIFAATQLAEALHVHRRVGLYPSRADEYGGDVRMRMERAAKITFDAYLNAVTDRIAYREAFISALHGVRVILSLCAAVAPAAISDVLAAGAGEAVDPRPMVLGYTAPQNLTGLPACAVRAGFDAEGMPVGVQFTGPSGADREVIAIARSFCQITQDIQARWPNFHDIVRVGTTP
jgi:aspartyl-tRNA(Asn)/glutamyl-tRNA(Gln) amidotransferase subunit A